VAFNASLTGIDFQSDPVPQSSRNVLGQGPRQMKQIGSGNRHCSPIISRIQHRRDKQQCATRSCFNGTQRLVRSCFKDRDHPAPALQNNRSQAFIPGKSRIGTGGKAMIRLAEKAGR
jgi:hypothetical protein